MYLALVALGLCVGQVIGYRNREIDGYNRGYLDGQNAVICAK